MFRTIPLRSRTHNNLGPEFGSFWLIWLLRESRPSRVPQARRTPAHLFVFWISQENDNLDNPPNVPLISDRSSHVPERPPMPGCCR